MIHLYTQRQSQLDTMDFRNCSREELVAMLSSQPVKVKTEQAETDATPVKLEKDSPRKASRSESCGSTVITMSRPIAKENAIPTLPEKRGHRLNYARYILTDWDISVKSRS
jgi:hypothetical protein